MKHCLLSLLVGALCYLPLSANANNPVITITGLNPSGGDNTAFVDVVQVLTGTTGITAVAGSVANPNFETSDVLTSGGGTYGYNPMGASWTFNGQSGIAANGSAFAPPATPDGTRVAFVQRAGFINQTLVLGAGTYRVTFQVAQRNCCSVTNDQQLNVLIDGVSVGTVQPANNGAYATFISIPFTVTTLGVVSLAPTRNARTVSRTAAVATTFNRPVTSASAANVAVFSSQFGGRKTTNAAVSSNTATATPNRYFFAGEVVNVTIPATVVSSASGEPNSTPQVYQFTTGVNSSTGVFSGTLDPAAGTNSANVALGDLNGDGRLDIVSADYGNNGGTTVSVILNTTTGTTVSYATRQAFTIGGSPYSVVLGDIDNDGRLDMATGNFTGSSASILLNTTASGSATMSFAPRVDLGTGGSPSGVALNDLDGDGRLDLAVAIQNGNLVSLFRNTTITAGTATFAVRQDFGTGNTPSNVIIADFDNDGRLDLATTNNGANTVSVLLNTGTTAGTLSFAAKVDFAVGAGAINSSINDIDGDGKMDIATADNGPTGNGTTTTILRNTTTTPGTVTFAAPVAFTIGTGSYNVAIGDINGDGKLDVVSADYGATGSGGTGATVSVLVNTGSIGTMNFAPRAFYSVGSGANDVKLGDMDGDGDLDIVTANQNASTTSVRINGVVGTLLPLPVELTAFTATAQRADVLLRWATAQEKNNAGFGIERSLNGTTFQAVGEVAGAGSSMMAHSYAYTDLQALAGAQVLYYRLRQQDQDGTLTYSPVRVVRLSETLTVELYPNPAQDAVTVMGTAAGTVVEVFDTRGRRVATATADASNTAYLKLPAELAGGLYVVRSGSWTSRLTVE